MKNMNRLLLAVILFSSIPCTAMEVIEADPTKVIIIKKDDGTVAVIQPREMDYQYRLNQRDKDKESRSAVEKIFGKRKCGLKGSF